MANEIHKDDIGIIFSVTVTDDGTARNLSGVTAAQFDFGKPDGTVATKTATVSGDGSSGIVTYTTVSNDLDQAGNWLLQAKLTEGASPIYKTAIGKFTVKGNLQ